jgi:UDP-N-acetyl-D-mannosaminuronate dehydrogenase
MANAFADLKAKIDQQEALVGVIGLGYVGLPLLQAFISSGFRTIGYDVDQAKVDRLLAGESYIKHIPSQWIAKWLSDDLFTATADMGRLSEADALLICVPTPLTSSRDPELSFVETTTGHIAAACKIVENTYRSVNIAMVNELKQLFGRLGSDVWEVIEGLNDIGKPVRRSRIGILGVAYKKDVDDPRESPSFKLMELLASQGAILSYNDPHIPVLPSMRNYDVPRLASEPLTADYLAREDCILIATDHSAYDWEMIARHSRLVVDTRGAMRDVVDPHANIKKA